MLLAAFALWAVLSSVNGACNDRTVAFMAVYDHDTYLTSMEKLVPNKVIINDCKAYNVKTGVFTAPRSGVYIFQFNTMCTSTKFSYIALYHNDVYVISAYAPAAGFESAGNSAILRLGIYDRVYVRAETSASVYGRSNEIYTTFSGYSIGL